MKSVPIGGLLTMCRNYCTYYNINADMPEIEGYRDYITTVSKTLEFFVSERESKK